MRSLGFGIRDFSVIGKMFVNRDFSITDTIYVTIEQIFLGHVHGICDRKITDTELHYMCS